MTTALSYLPMLLAIPGVAAMLKLAAFSYRRTKLNWKRAHLVAVGLFAVVFVGFFIEVTLTDRFDGFIKFPILIAGYGLIGAFLLGPACTLSDGTRGSPKTGLINIAILLASGHSLKLLQALLTNGSAV